MKKVVLFVFFLAIYSAVSAQKYIPVIKEGTIISYDGYSVALGQHIPLTLTIKSLGDPVKMQWDVEGYGTGTFEISAKAMENGNRLVIRQPEPDGITKLKENETIIVLSKAVFSNLVKDKAFELNNQKFTVATDTASYMLNSKAADVFHAISENGKSELWVINNPDFPLIYKGKSVTRGVDFTLTAIKE